MNKFVQWVINISAGIFFFFFFLLISFPFENLIQNALSQVEEQTGGVYRVTVGHINPNILFPSVFTDFQVHKKENGQDAVLVNFPEVKLGLSYLPLIAGKLKTSFACKGKSGKTVKGRFYISKAESSFEADFKDLRFSDIPYFQNLLQLPMEGGVAGEASGSFFSGQPVKNEAKADLKIKNLSIPSGTVIPKLNAELSDSLVLAGKDAANIKISLEKNKVEIKEVSFPGEDVILNLSGTVLINPRIAFSRVNVNGNLQFSQKVKDILGVALLVLGQEKGEQEGYAVSITGRLSKPVPRIGNLNFADFQPKQDPLLPEE